MSPPYDRSEFDYETLQRGSYAMYREKDGTLKCVTCPMREVNGDLPLAGSPAGAGREREL